MSRSRSGMVLIIAVGLAAILATFATVLLLRMRADARESGLVIAHAQSRAMLSAALMYLQESSRLGWGDEMGGAWGWTDLRDGSLGPRGMRPPQAGGPSADGTNFNSSATVLPAPRWWTTQYGVTPAYQPYPTSADERNPAAFPAPARRRWPLPGSAVRAPLPVWECPPYAIRSIHAANPVRAPVGYGDPAWDATWSAYANCGPPTAWLADILNADQGALGVLDPQPVQDTWTAFAAGRPGEYRPGSPARAWFRVYRELLGDHDNDRGNDDDYGLLGGDATAIAARSYDTVALYDPTDASSNPPLRNYSVFIIACGAGATQGYRFWSLPGNDPARALEPVTAQESGLFPSQEIFELMRRNEVVQWFRVEWTPLVGGFETDAMAATNYGIGWQRNALRNYPWPPVPAATPIGTNWSALVAPFYPGMSSAWQLGDSTRSYLSGGVQSQQSPGSGYGPGLQSNLVGTRQLSFGGCFKWIQRLDREPVKW